MITALYLGPIVSLFVLAWCYVEFVDYYVHRQTSFFRVLVVSLFVIAASSAWRLPLFGAWKVIVPMLALASIILLVCTCIRFRGAFFPLVGGVTANMVAVIANGGRMPALGTFTETSRHQQWSQSVRFEWLCDVIPLQIGNSLAYASVGDMFITLGYWWLVAHLIVLRLRRNHQKKS